MNADNQQRRLQKWQQSSLRSTKAHSRSVRTSMQDKDSERRDRIRVPWMTEHRIREYGPAARGDEDEDDIGMLPVGKEFMDDEMWDGESDEEEQLVAEADRTVPIRQYRYCDPGPTSCQQGAHQD
ncbi:hypothetical protein BGX33_011767 [Mortierella sp. NVP41]|nr:hypothetical protein BGX33_011767 [Mortierella sp. NVP41]